MRLSDNTDVTDWTEPRDIPEWGSRPALIIAQTPTEPIDALALPLGIAADELREQCDVTYLCRTEFDLAESVRRSDALSLAIRAGNWPVVMLLGARTALKFGVPINEIHSPARGVTVTAVRRLGKRTNLTPTQRQDHDSAVRKWWYLVRGDEQKADEASS